MMDYEIEILYLHMALRKLLLFTWRGMYFLKTIFLIIISTDTYLSFKNQHRMII